MKKAFAIGLLIIAAIPLMIAVSELPPHGSPDAPAHTHVSARYLGSGAEEAGAENIVTSVLLNYRGLDTLGEVVVIFTALAAVLGVLIVADTVTRHTTGSAGADRDEPDRPAMPVSPVVLFVVRLLAPFIALYAFYVMLYGHVSPGGGFQGGAILGALFIVLTVVLGSERTRPLLRPAPTAWLSVTAVLTFVVIGVLGVALTGSFLGYPAGAGAHLTREAMMVALEFGIGIGGAAIFATIFLRMEAD